MTDRQSSAALASEPRAGRQLPAPRFIPSLPDNLAYGWFDAAKPPVAQVDSGARVVVDCLPSWAPGLVAPAPFALLEEHRRAIAVLDKGPGFHLVTGPIAVRGAEPGDVLEVAIEDVSLRQDWGWYGVWPGKGVLPRRFSEETIAFVPFDRHAGTAQLRGGATIPLRPFFGILAVAPDSPSDRVSTIEPGPFGGNIDNRELIAGTSIVPAGLEDRRAVLRRRRPRRTGRRRSLADRHRDGAARDIPIDTAEAARVDAAARDHRHRLHRDGVRPRSRRRGRNRRRRDGRLDRRRRRHGGGGRLCAVQFRREPQSHPGGGWRQRRPRDDRAGAGRPAGA